MKSKSKLFIFFVLGVVISSFFVANITVYATDKESFAGFTTDVKLPDNQHKKEVTYFDLNLTPSQTQELEVLLTNATSKEIVVVPSINRAQTNRAGVVTYSVKSKQNTAGLAYNIEDIITITEKEIILKPHEEYTLKLHVKMPKQPFEGILAGGLYLYNKTIAKTEGNIKNNFAREIGLVLRTNDKSEEVVGDLALKKVSGDQENARNVISLLFENAQPAYLSAVDIKGTVTKYESQTPLLTLDKKNVSIAPNSTFDLPIPLNGEPFKAGTYEFKGTATQKEKVWHFDQKFQITSEEATNYNKKDVSIKKENIFESHLVLMLISLSLLLLIILLFVLFRIYKRKQEMKKRKEQRRKKKKRKKVLKSNETEKMQRKE
ncbi:DUF916 and DUF3324 domain-containing protein [Enterococcus ureasiticus]|uniref:Uncharacterized protein n=1 Tax=Enterococcus ureasiticus TaxID=903984 RepID=A0A1E5GF35_9ENTE|nr:DUF916 and DUF3324 domain-containing protein [Enterococcus ureasiticus]OEG11333.1 hypothetical protein BCR21_08515 [Enterococcus ureasiticus]